MKPADLHRVDASLLADDRAIQVAGEFEQRTAAGSSGLDEELLCDLVFNARTFALLALYIAGMLLAVGLAVPWVAALVHQGLAP